MLVVTLESWRGERSRVLVLTFAESVADDFPCAYPRSRFATRSVTILQPRSHHHRLCKLLPLELWPSIMAESIGEGSSKDVPAPPKKRSLFGNPAWSKPQESEEGIDFFSRAKELYPMRVAEEERKLQKKLVKQRQERKRSTASAERKASSTPEVKRQRLSSDAQDSDNSPSNQLLNDVFSSHE